MTRASALTNSEGDLPEDLKALQAEFYTAPTEVDEAQGEPVNQGMPVLPPHLGTADRIEDLANQLSPLTRGETIQNHLINTLINAVDEIRADLKLKPIDWGKVARSASEDPS